MTREWALFALLAVVALAGSAVVALASGGDDDGDPGPAMALERATSATGLPELLVTVSDDTNVADTTGGRKAVGLRCSDREGQTVVDARYPWPLDRDGQEPAPHIHQPASGGEIDRITRCALRGTRPSLQARLPLR